MIKVNDDKIKVINNEIDTYKRREQINSVYFYLIEGVKFKDIKSKYNLFWKAELLQINNYVKYSNFKTSSLAKSLNIKNNKLL